MAIVLKQGKISLSLKIFIYIAGFAGAILLVLWLFQIVFLDDFYRIVKTGQIKETANSIVDKINNDKLDEYLDTLTENSDYCIRIFEQQDVSVTGQVYYTNIENQSVCALQVVSSEEVKKLYEEAVKNNGTAIRSTKDTADEKIVGIENIKDEMLTRVVQPFEGITLGRIVERADGMNYFVVVNARTTPVDETKGTLKQQLIIISFILVFLTAIIAFFIARKISKPIRITNENAKNLAKGNLDISFEGKGYIEIEELNDTLNYAVHELSKVESMRKELIANMSHDLRTPLTMITGYSEAIRDLPGEDTKENIQVIIDECKRLTTLVNSILELSKIQAQGAKLNMQIFNLTELIHTIINRFHTMLEIEVYQFIFDPKETVYIEADELKISQVIYNIMGNAIHFTGDDKTVIIRQIVSKDTVRIEIEDTGNGIREEDIPYVWDRYYKLNTNHKRQQIGTGLGLSIVRGILELHQAKYGIISESGRGAIFYFELKISKKTIQKS